ncbi:GNAT family N-acetyltransferase [Paenibacillus sp. MMO-177]|uniref:GNAT family N-acetyltransferase n=1 Tax=Paenibacillus sp. MMO-177 TaxID=3081289 RepID=UPI00301AF58B
MNLTIRQEMPGDYSRTEIVVRKAFAKLEVSDQDEHNLVARIRSADSFIPELSLVAELNDEIVGHVLLSGITIRYGEEESVSLALAPVSVHPEYQDRGIGSKLIREALQRAEALEYPSVIVLGHPEYYPKFGFEKASKWGIRAPFEVSDDVFMALELKKNSLKSGVVEYPSVFFSG